MSRPQQSSIRSFFQPRRQPEYAAPPSAPPQGPDNNHVAVATTSPPAAPSAPPLPPTVGEPTQPPNAAGAKPVVLPISLPPNGVPVLPSPPSLPTGATIVPLEEHHIPALRRINSLLLPVAYPDSFYSKALDPLVSGLFSRAILWQDSDKDTPKVIGGLICRLEPNPFLDEQGQPLPPPRPPPSKSQSHTEIPLNTAFHAIYIQSLGLLSPYRSLGLAAAALEHVVASAAILPAAGSNIDVRTIYAHVWTENEEGLKWYAARGFTREGREPVKGYYFKLRPDTAWIVKRHIGPSALLPTQSSPVQRTSKFPTGTAGPGNVLAAAINLPPITTPPLPTSTLPPPTTAPPSISPTPPPPTTTTTAGPPRRSTASPAPSTASSLSFQNARPETEWNDLPVDMVTAAGRGGAPRNNSNNNNSQAQLLAAPTPPRGSRPGSEASSRSSSAAGAAGRKRRAYPSAAFGGP